MYDIIIKNGEKESFIKIVNGYLEGIKVCNGLVTKIDEEDLKILNLLKLGDNKIYIGKVDEWEVILDQKSGLKHFFNEGKEDIERFFNVNARDGLIYSKNIKDKKSILKEVLKFNLFDGIIVTCEVVVAAFILNNILALGNMAYFNYRVKVAEPFTYETAYDYIANNDNLGEKDKNILNNEKLLQDIIPYYNGTNMDYIIVKRFDDLHYSYYEKDADDKKNNKTTIGYYSWLVPNRINIKENLSEEKEQAAKCHEYVHLLQSSYVYGYITEASAEIIAAEYYGTHLTSYVDACRNLKILMEIGGPEMIWKLNFGGDDTALVNLIESNLDKEKAQKLLELLKLDPYSSKTMDKDIEDLLGELYYNVYKQDMAEDIYIANLRKMNLRDRYYFNSDLITKKVPFSLELMPLYKISKELTYDEWLKKEENMEFNKEFEIKMKWLDGTEKSNYFTKENYLKGKFKIYCTRKTPKLSMEEEQYYLKNGYEVQLIENGYVERVELPNIYECFKKENENSLEL